MAQFNVGAIKVGGARLTKLSAGIAIADGVARLGPLQADLYDGHYNGDIGIDVRLALPRLTMDEPHGRHRHREADEGLRQQWTALRQGQPRREARGHRPQR